MNKGSMEVAEQEHNSLALISEKEGECQSSL